MKSSTEKLADLFKVLATMAPDKAQQQVGRLTDLLDIKFSTATKTTSKENTDEADRTQAHTSRNTKPENTSQAHSLISLKQPIERSSEKLLRLYVNYQSSEKETVDRITSLLQEVHSPYQLMFWDAAEELKPGDKITEVIERGMENADICLLFLGSSYLSEDTDLQHLKLITDQNIRLIPIALIPFINISLLEIQHVLPQNKIPVEKMDQEQLFEFCEKIQQAITTQGGEMHQPQSLDDVDELPPENLTVAEPHIPLLPHNLLRAFLSRHLSLSGQGNELDIEQLVDQASRKQPLFPLPYQATSAFAHRFEVIIDLGSIMAIYHDDIKQVIEGVSRLCGKENLKVYHCFGSPLNSIKSTDKKPYQVPQSHATVLIFSLLGYHSNGDYFDRRTFAAWAAFLQPLHRNGIKVSHLSPIPPDRFTDTPLSWLNFINWGNSLRPVVDNPVVTAPSEDDDSASAMQIYQLERLGSGVFLLAQLMSITLCCSLPLLRLLRQTLARQTNQYDELKLLQSQTLEQLSTQELAFSAELADALRTSLFDANPALYGDAYAIIDQYRQQQQASGLLRFEEQCLNQPYLQQIDFETVEQKAQSILKTLNTNRQRREGVAMWMNRVFPTLTKPLQRVTSLSRGYAKAGSLLGQNSINSRAENSWLQEEFEPISVNFDWTGEQITCTQIVDPQEGSLITSYKIETDWHFAANDKPQLKITQPLPDKSKAVRRVMLKDNTPISCEGLSAQFPVSVTDMVGNKLMLMRKADVLFVCANEDFHYVDFMAKELNAGGISCLTLLNDGWYDEGIKIDMIKEQTPDVLIVALLRSTFTTNHDRPTIIGHDDNFIYIDFALFTNLAVGEFKRYTNIQHDEFSFERCMVVPHEPLDYPHNYPQGYFHILQKYTEKICQDLQLHDYDTGEEAKATIEALYNALKDKQVLTGQVSEIRPDYETEMTNMIIDFNGVEITVRPPEQGLKPIKELSALKDTEVEFIPVSEYENGNFDGSIRLAQLQQPEVQQWFDEHKVGDEVKGWPSVYDTNDGRESTIDLGPLTAKMYRYDFIDGQGLPYKLLQIDKTAGYVRVGQKQSDQDYQLKIKEYLYSNERLKGEVVKEHPDGVDIVLDGQFTGFLPNTEMLWGVDEQTGWAIQPLVIIDDHFTLKVLQQDPVNHFPQLSLKRLNADSFKESASQYQQGQQLSAELQTQHEDNILVILDDILALLPLSEIPYRHRVTPHLLDKYKEDSVAEVWIKSIDIDKEQLILTAMTQERENFQRFTDEYQRDTFINGRVIEFTEDTVFIEVDSTGPTPLGEYYVHQGDIRPNVGDDIKGEISEYDDERLIIILTDVTVENNEWNEMQQSTKSPEE